MQPDRGLELDPGAASPKYDAHHATEELLLLLTGEAILRSPAAERRLGSLLQGEPLFFSHDLPSR